MLAPMQTDPISNCWVVHHNDISLYVSICENKYKNKKRCCREERTPKRAGIICFLQIVKFATPVVHSYIIPLCKLPRNEKQKWRAIIRSFLWPRPSSHCKLSRLITKFFKTTRNVWWATPEQVLFYLYYYFIVPTIFLWCKPFHCSSIWNSV